MNRTDLMSRLDNALMIQLDEAIYWAEHRNIKEFAAEAVNRAIGIVFSASVIGLIDMKEYKAIIHTLTHSGLQN